MKELLFNLYILLSDFSISDNFSQAENEIITSFAELVVEKFRNCNK